MNTKIRFLDLLEDDLKEAAEREREMDAPRMLGRRDTRPERNWTKYVGVAAAVLVLAGSIGWFTNGREALRSQSAFDTVGEALSGGGAGDKAPVPQPSGVAERVNTVGNESFDADGALTDEQSQGTASTGGLVTKDLSKIARTGFISTVVPRDKMTDATSQVATIASRFGGIVFSESVATRTGTMVVQVPSAKFDETMTALKSSSIGRVTRAAVEGKDVTAEFVDLQAREKIAKGRLRVLFGLYAKTTTIEGTLRIQNALEDTQLQIEQINGQLNVINDKTSTATIRVDLREEGVQIQQQTDTVKNPSLGTAWDRSVQGFLGVVSAVVVGLGYLVPIFLIGLPVWLVIRSRRRRAAS